MSIREDPTEAAVRLALEEHVSQMHELGLVFHRRYDEEYLGFSIVMALSGSRDYIQVAHVDREDEELNPGDELIALNGRVIVLPSTRSLRLLQESIYGKRGARPITLTFVKSMSTPPKRANYVEHYYGQPRLPERDEVRKVLAAHVSQMDAAGLVVKHAFREQDLGFEISLETMGNDVAGREFLCVRKTFESCDLYPDRLKPGDELICVNDGLVVLPDRKNFKALLDSIQNARRPLHLTFIEGVDRDFKFAMQKAGIDTATAPSSHFTHANSAEKHDNYLDSVLDVMTCSLGGCSGGGALTNTEDFTFVQSANHHSTSPPAAPSRERDD